MDAYTIRGNLTLLTLVVVGLGVFLLLRPMPRYPVQAAIGSVLVVGGGIWLVLASVSTSVTWVLLSELLPQTVAKLLIDADVHKPEAGFLMLGLGMWATVAATSRRRGHSPVVLYEPEDRGTSDSTESELESSRKMD